MAHARARLGAGSVNYMSGVTTLAHRLNHRSTKSSSESSCNTLFHHDIVRIQALIDSRLDLVMVSCAVLSSLETRQAQSHPISIHCSTQINIDAK